MAENEEDPWAALRSASGPEADAGRLSHDAPERRATAWQWVRLWLREDVPGWFRDQFPDASKSLDSSAYIGITWRKRAVRDAAKAAFGKETDGRKGRIPLLILGRRVGVASTLILTFAVLCAVAAARAVAGI